MGDGGRRERDREGQVGQTKHRKHQYISSRCRTPTSVAFVIGIFAKIPYWAGIHVTYYRWNPTLVTGCIVISRVILGNITFGKGFSFVSISINIESWGLYLMISFRMFIFLSQRYGMDSIRVLHTLDGRRSCEVVTRRSPKCDNF